MTNDKLMQIAVYVWEIRKATNAKALGRDALEKALLELETLREKAADIKTPKQKADQQHLVQTLDSLIEMTENDILNHLAGLPSGLYDLPQFAKEA